GKLYVDGTLRSSLPWTLLSGTQGAPSTASPLLMGHYFTASGGWFPGEIDEVTLWNRALSASELNYLKHRRHSGTEDNLVAYCRFNEGSGATAGNTVGP